MTTRRRASSQISDSAEISPGKHRSPGRADAAFEFGDCFVQAPDGGLGDERMDSRSADSKSVLSIRPCRIGTPAAKHLAITSWRFMPLARASSSTVR